MCRSQLVLAQSRKLCCFLATFNFQSVYYLPPLSEAKNVIMEFLLNTSPMTLSKICYEYGNYSRKPCLCHLINANAQTKRLMARRHCVLLHIH